MTQLTSISFKQKIWFDETFQELKRKRKLSSVINDLLEQHLNIAKTETATTKQQIDDQLRELAARKAFLLDKQKSIEKEEEQNKPRLVIE